MDLGKEQFIFKKKQDSIIVSLDSIKINGNSNFKFSTKIDEPDIY